MAAGTCGHPLSWRAVRVVRPEVRVVDDTGFPKDGTSSPGVARQRFGTLEGPSLNNCQS
ncbi:transposase [Streptomyces sp. NPDC004296]|uniref:transposase n=1 Tax=Streptomyces sp. NPDC004296 TaxID=3364697 RepID=UPI00367A497F